MKKKFMLIRSSRSYLSNAVVLSFSYKCMDGLDWRHQITFPNILLLNHLILDTVDHNDQPNPPPLCHSSRGLHLTNPPQHPLNARRLPNRHRPPTLLQNHRHMRIRQNARSRQHLRSRVHPRTPGRKDRMHATVHRHRKEDVPILQLQRHLGSLSS